jgi:hypothetical protein
MVSEQASAPRLARSPLGPALLLAAAAAGLAPAPAAAQSPVDMVRDPWRPDPHWAETRDKPILIPSGELEDGEKISIFHWDSIGRIKLDPDDRDPDVWMGYRLLTVAVTSDLDPVDHCFYDVALAGAGRLGDLGEGWTLSTTAGMGSANDGSFRNADALYPFAAVVASQPPGTPACWRLGLSYYGNASLLPALPLPVVECDLEPAPEVRLRLGIPRTDIVVRPADGLSATLRWDYPTNALARLEQDLGSGWSLFTESNRRVDGFHMRESGSMRMFYELNGAEAGVRWITPCGDFLLSAGYAFEQAFFTGYDLRHRDAVGSPENGPYVALTVAGTF